MSAQADTLERATCDECGDDFTRTAGEDWKRLCLPCWKASPAAKKSAPDRLAQLTAELAEARAEAARLRLRVLALELADAPPAIPPDMLRRLVRLCHPDRHGQSEAANQATAWLLAQRNRMENRE
ncbi:hypothetical protein B447_12212 [Thauera sp. 27]|uniref:hypothetical protein n=1 Tax=Thauera sp. 27 TaxID=305700 RepID=UPI0002CF4A37|nr:hypothetical protein [Thauera sp. 27]ENO80542.1 hypothetical protein B447_12212 [Thauera sp. 27]